MRLVVDRAAEGAGGLAGALRAAVWEVDPDQPVSAVRPLEEVVADSISRQRFSMLTLGLFALVALVLGAVGIYGVLSYAVGERTREVGVRMALGARPADVLGWVLGRGLRPVVAGLAVGVVAALLVGRLLSGLLYGVGAADPATYAVICLGLLAVALAAIYLPARRATHIDPVASLRG
jgi:putative ABC transport system permease protein